MLFKTKENEMYDILLDYHQLLLSKTYNQLAWENGIVNLYGWLHPNTYCKILKCVIINDCYCFFGLCRNNKYRCVVTPIPMYKDYIDYNDFIAILDYAKSIGCVTNGVIYFTCSASLVEEINKHKIVSWHKYYPEFIFDRKAVVEMSGRSWQNKRSMIHKFKREHPNAKVRLANVSDIYGIDTVYNVWSVRKRSKGYSLHSTKTLHKELEFIFSDFGKTVSSMYVCEENNAIIGYISFGLLCKDTIQTIRRSVIISPEYKGLCEYIYHEGLKMFNVESKYINDGDGCDENSSLYFWKVHYNPVDMVKTGFVDLR